MNLNYMKDNLEIELEYETELHSLDFICDIVDKVVENDFKDNPIKKFKFIDKGEKEPNDLIEVIYVGGVRDLFIYLGINKPLLPYESDDDWD